MSKHFRQPSVLGSVLRVAGPSALAFALACPDSKTPSFFNPLTSGSPPDNTAPQATPIPAPTLVNPIHTDHVAAVIIDLQGSNGATPSKVNPASVSATANGQTLTTTRNGDEYDFSVVNLPDGQTTVISKYADSAGNAGTLTINFDKVTAGPKIVPTITLPASITATGPTVPLNWGGTIANSIIGTATGALLMPGPSNTCSDAVTPIPIGTVNVNTWNYLSTVKANGTYSATAVMTDPSPTSSAPTTVIVCNVIVASDIATDIKGNPNQNQSQLASLSTVVFPHSSSSLTVSTSYTFNATLMRFCTTVNTSAVRAGQTYSVTLTGPGGTTQSSTGTIDGTGVGHSSFPITQTGPYTGLVTLGTLQATFSATIPASGGTSGTC